MAGILQSHINKDENLKLELESTTSINYQALLIPRIIIRPLLTIETHPCRLAAHKGINLCFAAIQHALGSSIEFLTNFGWHMAS